MLARSASQKPTVVRLHLQDELSNRWHVEVCYHDAQSILAEDISDANECHMQD
jgi:hypothetical protein